MGVFSGKHGDAGQHGAQGFLNAGISSLQDVPRSIRFTNEQRAWRRLRRSGQPARGFVDDIRHSRLRMRRSVPRRHEAHRSVVRRTLSFRAERHPPRHAMWCISHF